ncbi:VQ motif-containing protein 29 [Bienertia sinuspersici]
MKQEDNRSAHQYDHLYSVNQSSKIMKKPQALAPSNTAPQPKVYKVKPIHFRELVQQLTGAKPHQQQQQQPHQPRPQRQQRRSNLQIVAPPLQPLDPRQLQLQLQTQKQKPFQFVDKLQNGVGTTELVLSPNFQAWFSFAMLSPGHANQQQTSLL